MKQIPLIFLFFLFLSSCADEKVPEGILPPEKMGNVLWDVFRADELVIYEQSLDSGLNKTARTVELYGQIFSLHQIKEADFKKSFAYYQDHPKILKRLLDTVQKRAIRYAELTAPKDTVK